MFWKYARYYDSALGRFLQADTIIRAKGSAALVSLGIVMGKADVPG